ncbi:MAG TPA: hypothetical protein VIK22_09190 [Candidatus Anoxymicrobiaceae bacterium]
MKPGSKRTMGIILLVVGGILVVVGVFGFAINIARMPGATQNNFEAASRSWFGTGVVFWLVVFVGIIVAASGGVVLVWDWLKATGKV